MYRTIVLFSTPTRGPVVRQGNLPCRLAPAPPKTKTSVLFTHPLALKVSFWGFPQTPARGGYPPLDSPYRSGRAQGMLSVTRHGGCPPFGNPHLGRASLGGIVDTGWRQRRQRRRPQCSLPTRSPSRCLSGVPPDPCQRGLAPSGLPLQIGTSSGDALSHPLRGLRSLGNPHLGNGWGAIRGRLTLFRSLRTIDVAGDG